MLAIRILLALAPLIHPVSSTMKDLNFAAVTGAANLVYSNHLLFDTPVSSKLRCLELCALTRCCSYFTYTGKRGNAGRCLGHSSELLTADEGTNSTGAMTYIWTGLRDIGDVAAEPSNMALGKNATMSPSNTPAPTVVDGDLDTNTCPHFTADSRGDSWMQVDLGVGSCGYDVSSVIITVPGSWCSHRLRDFDVIVYEDDPGTNPSAPETLCIRYSGYMATGVTQELVCNNGPIRGRYVQVKNTAGAQVALCELQSCGHHCKLNVCRCHCVVHEVRHDVLVERCLPPKLEIL